jgi:hypothetical protein
VLRPLLRQQAAQQRRVIRLLALKKKPKIHGLNSRHLTLQFRRSATLPRDCQPVRERCLRADLLALSS